jgi:hypothetical protein
MRAFLYALDLIELNGDDIRHDPLEGRKATLPFGTFAFTPGQTFSLTRTPPRACGPSQGYNPSPRYTRRAYLNFVWYNFVKLHKAHKLTPAMAAGDH